MGLFANSALRPVRKTADKVMALENTYEKMTDEELRAKTDEFKSRYRRGETLDQLLPEVFAQVREASSRVLGMKHFYEQVLGGIALHQGNIAEMKTGEGKTLVATLPAVLNAIPGDGVHIVTVNEYLAKRDSEWMGKVYRFLGYKVGLVMRAQDRPQKQEAYGADIIYSTNNELGFDYLRDNMVGRKEDMVQRGLAYAIVDEVDSILIDEARTPLIISGQGDEGTSLYRDADRFVKRLKEGEGFELDEKLRTINLTEDGTKAAEKYFGKGSLSDVENTELAHHINQALKANYLFFRDKEYVVENDEVIIVDEFTGRLMIGRRYSDGLHQAIEAKEGVTVERESKTLATITFQNFFRMYKKLAGMTGTAKTEEEEFNAIYNLNVIVIPTHMPMIREDQSDIVYATKKGKFDAVVDEVERVHKTGQPILVGTVSVAENEDLSRLLGKRGIPHQVLNAKNHQHEAQIIAQAGKLGAVTIATNMAGRGTDILLGGNPEYSARATMRLEGVDDELIEQAVGHGATDDPEVLEARKRYGELYAQYKKATDAEHDKVTALGGLYIIGTERHESRRIDNQLRGRSGRQGDPGSSVFYVALEDDLMRLFGGERIKGMLQKIAGDEEDIPLQYKMLSKQIENAQKRIEGNNFDIRKHVLQFDDVMNQQRKVIYEQRREVLMGEDISKSIRQMVDSVAESALDTYCPKAVYPEEWDWRGFSQYMEKTFGIEVPTYTELEKEELDRDEFEKKMLDMVRNKYAQREKELTGQGADMRAIERFLLLGSVDTRWMDHIDAMDQLRKGIGLRSLGQRDPVVEYRMEGFDMFEEMVAAIREETVSKLFHVRVETRMEQRPQVRNLRANVDADGRPTDSSPAPAATGAARRPPQAVAAGGRGRVAGQTPAAIAAQHKKQTTANSNAGEGKQMPYRAGKRVGRNDPCPCGSGKKFKNCCGKAQNQAQQ